MRRAEDKNDDLKQNKKKLGKVWIAWKITLKLISWFLYNVLQF